MKGRDKTLKSTQIHTTEGSSKLYNQGQQKESVIVLIKKG